jgi:hypothetical protein
MEVPKARDLRRHVSEAPHKGKWGGGADVIQLVDRLAASG